MRTEDLINNLANNATAVKPLQKPMRLVLQLLLFALVYYVIIQIFIGVRSDIFEKISQPFFVIEILLMLSLLFSCLITSVLTIFPDSYQKFYLLRAPYTILLTLISFFIIEFCLQNQENLPAFSTHKIECSLCIAAFALIPSFYFFYVMRKGANINPLKAGGFAVLASTAISSIALRVSEQHDTLLHLLAWHYFPVLFFAVVGAVFGKLLFKW